MKEQTGYSSLEERKSMEQNEQGLGRPTLCFLPPCPCFQVSHQVQHLGGDYGSPSLLFPCSRHQPTVSALPFSPVPPLHSCRFLFRSESVLTTGSQSTHAGLHHVAPITSLICLQQLEGVISIPSSHNLGLPHSVPSQLLRPNPPLLGSFLLIL